MDNGMSGFSRKKSANISPKKKTSGIEVNNRYVNRAGSTMRPGTKTAAKKGKKITNMNFQEA
jgi:hypothetical protein